VHRSEMFFIAHIKYEYARDYTLRCARERAVFGRHFEYDNTKIHGTYIYMIDANIHVHLFFQALSV
jgi:hypothetical protein